LRCIIMGMFAAMPLFAVSLTYIVDDPRPAGLAPLAVVAVGLLSTLAISIVGRRPLATTSLEALAASWGTRFFIGLGFAQVPALLGFALTLPTAALWVYLIGMVFSLIGFWRVAPSRRNLGRDQETLLSGRSSLDLTQALILAGPLGSGSPPKLDG
jgi:hypothetical protein